MIKNVLLIILIFSIKINAQDPLLIENDWHLQKVIINGIDYPAPNNKEIQDIVAIFDVPGFSTTICNVLSGIVEYDTSNSFQFIETPFISLGNCELSQNSDYEDIYLTDFYLLESDFPFQYNIISGSEGLLLTVSNNSGNQAIYGDTILSLQELSTLPLNIYPNPTKDILSVSLSEVIFCSRINIIDINGKVLMQFNDIKTNIKVIDVSKLLTGIYFLSIEIENGEKLIKKFVKN